MLARRIGLTNTTFRRCYPDIARELSELRADPTTGRRTGPSAHDKLIARSAKLRRRNRELTDQLAPAAAEIQRLSLLLSHYVAAAEDTSKVTHISRRDTGR